MADQGEQMTEDLRGYQSYWKRVARHVSISDAAKQIGIRASVLSSFERGNPHELTDEQIETLWAWLETIEIDIREEPEIPAE
jgi:hypothetical protein